MLVAVMTTALSSFKNDISRSDAVGKTHDAVHSLGGQIEIIARRIEGLRLSKDLIRFLPASSHRLGQRSTPATPARRAIHPSML